jgi:hypothetical protein
MFAWPNISVFMTAMGTALLGGPPWQALVLTLLATATVVAAIHISNGTYDGWEHLEVESRRC